MHHQSNIVAVFAHPDDETWINGTVALIASKTSRFHVVYVTSGDAGTDVSGQDLEDEALAREREREAQKALTALGVQAPPIFLRLPDSHLQERENQLLMQSKLNALFQERQPEVVLTFGEDGITGHTDHRLVGIATRRAADESKSVRVVLNIAISEQRAKALNDYAADMGIDLPSIYPTLPVDKTSVDLRINVEKFATQRIEAFASHKTQFPPRLNTLWQEFVSRQHKEEIIVSRRHKTQSGIFERVLADDSIERLDLNNGRHPEHDRHPEQGVQK
ncbi:MAG: PIG-L family deacetylase [Exilibacterium sp.]